MLSCLVCELDKCFSIISTNAVLVLRDKNTRKFSLVCLQIICFALLYYRQQSLSLRLFIKMAYSFRCRGYVMLNRQRVLILINFASYSGSCVFKSRLGDCLFCGFSSLLSDKKKAWIS